MGKHGSSFVLDNVIDELRVFGIHMSSTLYDPNTFKAMKRLYIIEKDERVCLLEWCFEDFQDTKLLNQIDSLFKEDLNVKKIVAKYRLSKI